VDVSFGSILDLAAGKCTFDGPGQQKLFREGACGVTLPALKRGMGSVKLH
jgi:hypothetical protein